MKQIFKRTFILLLVWIVLCISLFSYVTYYLTKTAELYIKNTSETTINNLEIRYTNWWKVINVNPLYAWDTYKHIVDTSKEGSIYIQYSANWKTFEKTAVWYVFSAYSDDVTINIP